MMPAIRGQSQLGSQSRSRPSIVAGHMRMLWVALDGDQHHGLHRANLWCHSTSTRPHLRLLRDRQALPPHRVLFGVSEAAGQLAWGKGQRGHSTPDSS